MRKYFIRTLVACAFGWVGIFTVTATAHASLIEFEGSYEVDLSQAGSDPGLVIKKFPNPVRWLFWV